MSSNALPLNILADAYWEGCQTALESMNRVADQVETLVRTTLDQAHENRVAAQRAVLSATSQLKAASDATFKLSEDTIKFVTPFFPAVGKAVESRSV
jgi:hypothetical protein